MTTTWDQHARTCKCEAARRQLNDSNIELSCPMCAYNAANPLPSIQTIQRTMSTAMPNLETRSCYKCRMPGHLIRNCPLNANRNNAVINRLGPELTDKVQQTQRTLQHVQEIYGTCRIDDNLCSYLLDTGSNRTVVHKRIFSASALKDVIPVNFQVLTANGELANIIGQKRCQLQLGSTTCVADFLIAGDLYNDCLLGMDVLTTCPLTQTAIQQLYNVVNTALSPFATEFICNTTTSDAHLCRLQIMSPQECISVLKQNQVVTKLSEPEKEDVNASDQELPDQVFHDIFNIIEKTECTPDVKNSLNITSEETEAVNSILTVLKEYFHDIQATTMSDLMRDTN